MTTSNMNTPDCQAANDRIRENPFSSEGYRLLGDVLKDSNPAQAYLCYENALFYCREADTSRCLEQRMQEFRDLHMAPPRTAIVILSYNQLELTRACLESLRCNVSPNAAEIIFVDNASSDGSAEYLKAQPDIRLQINTENSGFPGGCNQGIAMADPDSDILLLNNDTVIMPNTLFWLRMGLYSASSVGSAGSVSNNAWGQWAGENNRDMSYYTDFAAQTNLPMDLPYEYRLTIIGFCLLLKRTALEQTGYLDEYFFPANCEDDDLNLRMILAGYENILVKNSYLYHKGHASFDPSSYYADLAAGIGKFNAKYRYDLRSFFLKNDLLCDTLTSGYLHPGMSLLEVNCGMGASLLWLKSNFPEVRMDGIDREPGAVAFRQQIKTVNLYTYVNIKYLPVADRKYDVITLDTKTIRKEELAEYLTELSDHLKPGGKLLFNIENPFHYAKWIRFLLDGTLPDRSIYEAITYDDVAAILCGKGLSIRGTIFVFQSWDHDPDKVKMEPVINALPKERANNVNIREWVIEAGR